MRKLITLMSATLAIAVCSTAVAGDDACQALRDQYAQTCKAQTNKWSALIAGVACVASAKAIHDCEAQQAQQDQSSDEESSTKEEDR